MQIAFYGSTPAYRPILDRHGGGELQPELRTLSTQGRWAEMAAVVPDEVVDGLAVLGTPAEVAATLRARYAGRWTRVGLGLTVPPPPEVVADVVSRTTSA